MVRSDKFLAGIVGAILLLVVVAVVVVLVRPDAEYRPEDSPENVVHNYLLALQLEDYERAYSYLSPELRHYPRTTADFVSDLSDNYWFRQTASSSLTVNGATISGDTAAVEVVEIRYHSGSLFGSSQSQDTYIVTVKRIDGQWRVADSAFYFAYCWNATYGCR